MWTYEHKGFSVHQIPALSDNYIYLIDIDKNNLLAAVDPATCEDVAATCKRMNRKLTHILNTHHHWDHTGGNIELKQRFGCTIIGAEHDAARIPGIDVLACEDKPLEIGGVNIRVLDVQGHTRGHIAYLIGDALFCGDTLFGAGCGRLFEGSPEQMLNSLKKISQLHDKTLFYCAHEYTENNLSFALGADPDNTELQARIQRVRQLRQSKTPTIPGTLAEERATNPFLRSLDAAFCQEYAARNDISGDALSVFTHLRRARDHW